MKPAATDASRRDDHGDQGGRLTLRAGAREAASIAVILAARTVLTLLVALLFWSLAPMVAGWSSQVVVSGSMMPRIATGDVVVSMPVGAEFVQPGQVILVDNPAKPGSLLMHRLVERKVDGSLITRGDANSSVDSTPVPPEGVRGLPRIRIPYVGLPFVWLGEGRFGPLLVTALLLFAALYLGVDAATQSPARPREAT